MEYLPAVLTRSLQFRLTVIFVAVATATLAAFGIIGQYRLAAELGENFAEMKQATVQRLANSLASPLWDVNRESVDNTLAAEMLRPEVAAIQVFDVGDRLFAARVRKEAGAAQPAGQHESPPG
ncbi:MAG: hypothetical protein ACM31P_13320, partial [Actinomycetota bacterium]